MADFEMTFSETDSEIEMGFEEIQAELYSLQQKTVQGGLAQIVVTADPQYQALESVTVTALPVWEGGSY